MKKEFTGELRNIKKGLEDHKRQLKWVMLSLVKENPSTTSSQVQNTLEEVGGIFVKVCN